MAASRSISRRTLLGACAAAALPGVLLSRTSEPLSFPEPRTRPWLAHPADLPTGAPLVAAPLTVTMPGLPRQQRLCGYNGMLPGPTLRVRRGQPFRQTVLNRLDEDTVVHWHGLIAPTEMDGQPRYPIAPGGHTRIAYPVQQRAAMHWYHPHPHGATARQAWQGMAGLFIVEDEEEAALGLPSGAHELLLVLRDGLLSKRRKWVYPDTPEGSIGDFPLVNGIPWPRTQLPQGWARLRVLNGANARVFDLRCDLPMVLIGNDGGLLEAPQTVRAIEMAPAERVDLLLDLRGAAAGQHVGLYCMAAGWKLLDIEVTAEPTAARSAWEPPATLSRIERLVHTAEEPDRAFVFQDNSLINGLEHDMYRTDFVVPFGKVEKWRFVAIGEMPHPVHTHGAHFQVVGGTAANGEPRRIEAWERGWKDTVLVRPQEAVDVLVRFDRYEGNYLLHCHNLEHEDGGMMQNFVVARDVEMAKRIIENERLFGSAQLCQPWA
ncbi:multicopper oxidase family protein [Lampropedia cohaerens]|uniref:multicopper oxidase family protein n=1 Tax=Lampropedia cohaerens TaxID=1610491 RepID=UPI00069BDF4B|nr:multicopper oxidase domain-containing protein [Lampropedia cohaerens]